MDYRITNILINQWKDLVEADLEYDSRDLSSAYTIKAIMASGFGIGKNSSNS